MPSPLPILSVPPFEGFEEDALREWGDFFRGKMAEWAIDLQTALAADAQDNDDQGTIIKSHLQFFNGTLLETFDAIVTSDGAVVTMSLEQSGTGDLTMLFSDGQTKLDCTPALTIALTAGTDSSPQDNFIYIPQSTKVLTKSTTGWPAAEHIKVGYFLVPTASLVNTGSAGNNFIYINQNWNDHVQGTDGQGHLSHIGKLLRHLGAIWYSGALGTATQDGNDLWVDVASGVVYQVHPHTFAALDSDTDGAGDPIMVVNDPDAAYTVINSLNEITKDSDGDLIGNNKYVKFVLWGVANKDGEVSPMMLNLPSGTYNSEAAAALDTAGYAEFSIPFEFNLESSTGFLIAAFVCQHMAGSMDIKQTIDLRGQTPQTLGVGGSSPGAGDVTAAAALTDHALIRGDGGFKGVQGSGILIDDADNITGIVGLSMSAALVSTLATGAAPFTIASITVNTNLNADLWDGYQFADYLDQAVKQASGPTFASVTLGDRINFENGAYLVEDIDTLLQLVNAIYYTAWDMGAGDKQVFYARNLNAAGTGVYSRFHFFNVAHRYWCFGSDGGAFNIFGFSQAADMSNIVCYIDPSGNFAANAVRLAETATPDDIANTGWIHTKDDGGDTELHYLDDSDNEVQITKDGEINLYYV